VKIVVGLGNPGKQYQDTRHNVGFAVVEALAKQLPGNLRRSWRLQARIGKTERHGQPVWLVEPLTYMNNSGRAVAAVLRAARAGADNLVVVLDDADLPVGRLRIRRSGGSGGHKGLASIISFLGTEAFTRVRIGIGHSAAGGLIEHVLQPFSASERERMAVVIDQAAQAVLCIIDSGVEEAMNLFNGWVGPWERSSAAPSL